jgi:hypothetical protein
MAEDENGNLEPPPRKSIDDPGAHDLGKDLHSLQKCTLNFKIDKLYF